MPDPSTQPTVVDSLEEQHSLKISAWVCLLMAGLGIIFAAIARSEAILLDGIFNGISAASVYMAARLAAVIHCKGDKIFQFGYAHFEPLINTMRGLLTLTVSIFAFFSAVNNIINGGSGLNPGLAILYSVTIGTACGAMAVLQKRRAHQTQSPMVTVDAQNWIINAAITATVGIAFAIAFVLQKTPLKGFVPYVDSILVIILTLVTCPMPVRTIRDNVRQIFQMAPDEATQEAVHDRIRHVLEGVGTDDTTIRMGRIGRFLYVVLGLVVREDFQCRRVKALDDLRQRLEEKLADLNEQVVLDMVVTEDPKYATLRIVPRTARKQ